MMIMSNGALVLLNICCTFLQVSLELQIVLFDQVNLEVELPGNGRQAYTISIVIKYHRLSQ